MDNMLDSTKRIYPFNNNIETGLRVLSLLYAAFPTTYDISTLVLYDYLTVHSGDVDVNVSSLHPPVPNRSGEIFVRRNIIEDGLELFASRGLVEKVFTDNGIEFKASEESAPFLDSLSEPYALKLIARAEWVIKTFSSLSFEDLRAFMKDNIDKQKKEFNLDILD